MKHLSDRLMKTGVFLRIFEQFFLVAGANNAQAMQVYFSK